MTKQTLYRLSQICVLLAAFHLPQAQAGMFDDEEARGQIRDLSAQTNQRFETQQKALFDMTNQIQALRDENAKLRGQVETLTYELESAKKSQRDFYKDLDERLRKFESGAPAAAHDQAEAKGGEEPKSTGDPVAQANEYEAALNLFKGNKIKEAASAFDSFVKTHPNSSWTPSAQFWLGNAHYALRDCKKAIEAYKVVVQKWPKNAKAPDALVSMATCQQELGDNKGARSTLESVLSTYPDSPAAATAKQRLKK